MPRRGRALCKLLEQARADPPALMLVCHGERDLCDGWIPETRIVGERDDPLPAVVGQRPDEGAPLDPVRIEERLDEGRTDGRRAVEAEVEAALGEAAEELGQCLGVSSLRRTEPQGAAVPEDDVDDSAAGEEDRAPGERPVRGELDSSGKGL